MLRARLNSQFEPQNQIMVVVCIFPYILVRYIIGIIIGVKEPFYDEEGIIAQYHERK